MKFRTRARASATARANLGGPGPLNPWWIMDNWSRFVGCPMHTWDFITERDPEEPDILSLLGAGLESFADPEVASHFLEDVAGIHFDIGPDEYRRLAANWRDRSKAEAFVAEGVRQDMIMNSEEAPAEDWITAF